MLRTKDQEAGLLGLEQLNKGKANTKKGIIDFTVNGASTDDKVIINGISYLFGEDITVKDSRGKESIERVETSFGQLSRTSKGKSSFSMILDGEEISFDGDDKTYQNREYSDFLLTSGISFQKDYEEIMLIMEYFNKRLFDNKDNLKEFLLKMDEFKLQDDLNLLLETMSIIYNEYIDDTEFKDKSERAVYILNNTDFTEKVDTLVSCFEVKFDISESKSRNIARDIFSRRQDDYLSLVEDVRGLIELRENLNKQKIPSTFKKHNKEILKEFKPRLRTIETNIAQINKYNEKILKGTITREEASNFNQLVESIGKDISYICGRLKDEERIPLFSVEKAVEYALAMNKSDYNISQKISLDEFVTINETLYDSFSVNDYHKIINTIKSKNSSIMRTYKGMDVYLTSQEILKAEQKMDISIETLQEKLPKMNASIEKIIEDVRANDKTNQDELLTLIDFTRSTLDDGERFARALNAQSGGFVAFREDLDDTARKMFANILKRDSNITDVSHMTKKQFFDSFKTYTIEANEKIAKGYFIDSIRGVDRAIDEKHMLDYIYPLIKDKNSFDANISDVMEKNTTIYQGVLRELDSSKMKNNLFSNFVRDVQIKLERNLDFTNNDDIRLLRKTLLEEEKNFEIDNLNKIRNVLEYIETANDAQSLQGKNPAVLIALIREVDPSFNDEKFISSTNGLNEEIKKHLESAQALDDADLKKNLEIAKKFLEENLKSDEKNKALKDDGTSKEDKSKDAIVKIEAMLEHTRNLAIINDVFIAAQKRDVSTWSKFDTYFSDKDNLMLSFLPIGSSMEDIRKDFGAMLQFRENLENAYLSILKSNEDGTSNDKLLETKLANALNYLDGALTDTTLDPKSHINTNTSVKRAELYIQYKEELDILRSKIEGTYSYEDRTRAELLSETQKIFSARTLDNSEKAKLFDTYFGDICPLVNGKKATEEEKAKAFDKIIESGKYPEDLTRTNGFFKRDVTSSDSRKFESSLDKKLIDIIQKESDFSGEFNLLMRRLEDSHKAIFVNRNELESESNESSRTDNNYAKLKEQINFATKTFVDDVIRITGDNGPNKGENKYKELALIASLRTEPNGVNKIRETLLRCLTDEQIRTLDLPETTQFSKLFKGDNNLIDIKTSLQTWESKELENVQKLLRDYIGDDSKKAIELLKSFEEYYAVIENNPSAEELYIASLNDILDGENIRIALTGPDSDLIRKENGTDSFLDRAYLVDGDRKELLSNNLNVYDNISLLNKISEEYSIQEIKVEEARIVLEDTFKDKIFEPLFIGLDDNERNALIEKSLEIVNDFKDKEFKDPEIQKTFKQELERVLGSELVEDLELKDTDYERMFKAFRDFSLDKENIKNDMEDSIKTHLSNITGREKDDVRNLEILDNLYSQLNSFEGSVKLEVEMSEDAQENYLKALNSMLDLYDKDNTVLIQSTLGQVPISLNAEDLEYLRGGFIDGEIDYDARERLVEKYLEVSKQLVGYEEIDKDKLIYVLDEVTKDDGKGMAKEDDKSFEDDVNKTLDNPSTLETNEVVEKDDDIKFEYKLRDEDKAILKDDELIKAIEDFLSDGTKTKEDLEKLLDEEAIDPDVRKIGDLDITDDMVYMIEDYLGSNEFENLSENLDEFKSIVVENELEQEEKDETSRKVVYILPDEKVEKLLEILENRNIEDERKDVIFDKLQTILDSDEFKELKTNEEKSQYFKSLRKDVNTNEMEGNQSSLVDGLSKDERIALRQILMELSTNSLDWEKLKQEVVVDKEGRLIIDNDTNSIQESAMTSLEEYRLQAIEKMTQGVNESTSLSETRQKIGEILTEYADDRDKDVEKVRFDKALSMITSSEEIQPQLKASILNEVVEQLEDKGIDTSKVEEEVKAIKENSKPSKELIENIKSDLVGDAKKIAIDEKKNNDSKYDDFVKHFYTGDESSINVRNASDTLKVQVTELMARNFANKIKEAQTLEELSGNLGEFEARMTVLRECVGDINKTKINGTSINSIFVNNVINELSPEDKEKALHIFDMLGEKSCVKAMKYSEEPKLQVVITIDDEGKMGQARLVEEKEVEKVKVQESIQEGASKFVETLKETSRRLSSKEEKEIIGVINKLEKEGKVNDEEVSKVISNLDKLGISLNDSEKATLRTDFTTQGGALESYNFDKIKDSLKNKIDSDEKREELKKEVTEGIVKQQEINF